MLYSKKEAPAIFLGLFFSGVSSDFAIEIYGWNPPIPAFFFQAKWLVKVDPDTVWFPHRLVPLLMETEQHHSLEAIATRAIPWSTIFFRIWATEMWLQMWKDAGKMVDSVGSEGQFQVLVWFWMKVLVGPLETSDEHQWHQWTNLLCIFLWVAVHQVQDQCVWCFCRNRPESKLEWSLIWTWVTLLHPSNPCTVT